MLRLLILGLSLLPLLVDCSMTGRDKIDFLFEAYQGDVPGAAFMVIHKGEILDERYYGLADIEQKTKVSRTTNFRLASVSKQFTAMAILQLMDQGIIKFSTGLQHVFPEFPEYAEHITYGQLLHHTSGLISYEYLIPDTAIIPVKDIDVLELLLQEDSTYFPPGSDYRYSNSGYALLALTVERLSGSSFSKYLEENIFKPSRMEQSVAYVNGVNSVPDRAFGYHVIDEDIEFSDQSMTSSVLGDGGIYSSIADLFNWDQELYNTDLVSKALLDSAYSPWLKNYGCGWRIEDYKGLKRISQVAPVAFERIIKDFRTQSFLLSS